MLTNRVYIGELSFRDVTVTGAHPPLIDEATFTQAVAIMDARGEQWSRRASNNSDYHLTGRVRCPTCGKALIGTAATSRNKTYRYYTCWSRARYGTATCDAHRINAETFDTAVFTALTNFYRDHHDLIAQAVALNTVEHDANIGDRHAELTTLEKELTRATTAIDRYLQAFEDGEMDPATVNTRMNTLTHKITQLTARSDDLADELAQAPTVPPAPFLHELAEHIRHVLTTGSPAPRKALIENLVAEVKITGPDAFIPVFRIPQPRPSSTNTKAGAATTAAPASGKAVRTMVEPVGRVGLDPTT